MDKKKIKDLQKRVSNFTEDLSKLMTKYGIDKLLYAIELDKNIQAMVLFPNKDPDIEIIEIFNMYATIGKAIQELEPSYNETIH